MSVYMLLRQSNDPSSSVCQASMEQLKNLEKTPGFCSILYAIIASKETEFNSRLLSAIYFKNCIDKYWRERVDSQGVSAEEKIYLRENILPLLLNEESPQISLQLSLLISKIARIDHPQAWPQLLDRLVEIIRTNQSLSRERKRGLLALKEVIVQLSGKRLPHCKREFVQVTGKLFVFVEETWAGSLTGVLVGLSSLARGEIGPNVLEALVPQAEEARLSLHILKNLVIHGLHQDLNDLPYVVHFLNHSFTFLSNLIASRTSVVENPLTKQTDKLTVQLARLLNELQRSQPDSFENLSIPFLDLFYRYVATSFQSSFDRFLLQALLFLKAAIDHVPSAPLTTWAKPSPHELFFTEEKVVALTQTLIGCYFVLSEEDLRAWADSPEQFHIDTEQISWETRIHPCAEIVYMALLMKKREIVAPIVVKLLQEVVQRPAEEDSPNFSRWVLSKEACYCGVALGYNDLYNHFDFPSFFSTYLARDFLQPSPMYRIIKRRAVILIGCWVSEITDEMRKPIYQVVINLMADQDVVIALSATTTLKILIDDCKFYVDSFLEYLNTVVDLLFRLMMNLHQDDTILQVLDVLSTLTERVAEKISPFTGRILECLSRLWSEYRDHKLMKSAIVHAFKRLVKTQERGIEEEVVNFLIPFVLHSTDMNEGDSLYLMDHGLGLWLYVLRKARTFSQALFSLFPNLVNSLSISFEFI
eukprot:TRINITY_DN5793_c0_g1_i2.p1 TRINITY_DN5793_c0_g1~~TRINITY_DN5793_c0_g1_i2.p1  ORF type:complete len:721 (-),score=154.85 TRINITY_DN5793_c0_g1_i2:794-2899(-)